MIYEFTATGAENTIRIPINSSPRIPKAAATVIITTGTITRRSTSPAVNCLQYFLTASSLNSAPSAINASGVAILATPDMVDSTHVINWIPDRFNNIPNTEAIINGFWIIPSITFFIFIFCPRKYSRSATDRILNRGITIAINSDTAPV